MARKEKMNETEMKEMEGKIEEKVTTAMTTAITVLIQAAIVFGITLIVLKFVWTWMVPDLFPGAVAQGLISADLTWKTAVKFAVIMTFISGANGSFKETINARNC